MESEVEKYINLLALPNHLGTEEINNGIDSYLEGYETILHIAQTTWINIELRWKYI